MTNEITFALDIGTRTIIGILIKKNGNKYEIIDSAVREHQTRAMLDGQIHNVARVADSVAEVKKELEKKSGLSLKNVAIAAAGRALKTVMQTHNIEFERSRYVEEKDLKTLELEAIQESQKKLKKSDISSENNDVLDEESQNTSEVDYHFVGYTVRKYKLDGMEIGHLLGQKGKNMEVELVATFLPRIVIDSLLAVINRVGLEVEHLTLEPIAASHVVIPEAMINFNLALVDIGAGTSDIAITKNGSISGYAMVPIAGDEITEIISENFLVDYNNAEKLKCKLTGNDSLEVKTILGKTLDLSKEEVLKSIERELENLSGSIADKILEINSTPPQAVIFIGGGSLTPGLIEKFANKIDIIENRIGIRKREDLNNITGEIKGVNTTQTLTPIGIAITTIETQSKAVFLEIEVNDERINLLTFSQPKVADALLAADIKIEQFRPHPGMGIAANVNGNLKIIKGEMGSSGEVLLNNKKVDLKEKVNNGDKVIFKPGKSGVDAEAKIRDVIPKSDLKSYTIYLNGTKNKVETRILQNGKLVNSDQDLIDGAEIEYTVPKTLKDGLSQIMDIPPEKIKNEGIQYIYNGQEEIVSKSNYLITFEQKKKDLEEHLKDGMKLEIEEQGNSCLTIRDLLQKKGNKEIVFYFNGSELTVPDQIWEIKINGEKEDLNYKIKDGDQITAFSRTLTIKGVFNYINYEISETMRKKLQLILNGNNADLSTKITENDELNVKLNG
jgi:cell division protein FtsA